MKTLGWLLTRLENGVAQIEKNFHVIIFNNKNSEPRKRMNFKLCTKELLKLEISREEILSYIVLI